MIVLGLSLQHDSGAALVSDGVILAAVNEERLNRVKLYWGVPELSVQEILRITQISPDKIDRVVISNLTSGDPYGSFDELAEDWRMRVLELGSYVGLTRMIGGTEKGVKALRWLQMKMPKFKMYNDTVDMLKRMGINAPVEQYEHHDGHAASAYYTGGKETALAVTCDAVGDGYSAKVFVCDRGKMSEIKAVPFYHSIGNPYRYITHMLGFKENRHEGKITGLAAYGNPAKGCEILNRRLFYDSDKLTFINRGRFLRPEINALRELFKNLSREDIAAAVQQHLEDTVVPFIRDAVKLTGIRDVVLAGGVFSNVKLNQRIWELEGVQSVYIHPNMGDGGLCAGAALHVWYRENGSEKIHSIEHAYFGGEYLESDMEAALIESSLPYTRPDSIEEAVAQTLADGKIVARVSGPMEYGPRALGNRSILYKTTDNTVNDWLNKHLNRTEFMPFAPILLESDAPAFFEGFDNRNMYAARFMTTTFDVTEKCKTEAPAITHIDGTARPQCVRKDVQPELAEIITLYKQKTGLSTLINTSFNMHEEPIVCTPRDAIRSFVQGHLDTLALGPFLVNQQNPTPRTDYSDE